MQKNSRGAAKQKARNPQRFLDLRHEIVVDNFAGGGGASTGIAAGIGREVDIAVNHDRDAIFMHTVNHPESVHFQEDVFAIDIREATRGQPVGLAWFSPDCKHFSKAKGSKPVSKKIRGLAWVAIKWAKIAKPRVIMLENVEEFQTWGPLLEVRGKWMPDPERKGQTFKRWVTTLRNLGYNVEWRELRACDFGAPTIRKRLFVVARRDGLPIVWPKPTHGKAPGLLPFRTAAECIRFDKYKCPSIFTRKRALKPATHRRIATGIMRYVVNCADPFIVPITHSGSDSRVHPIGEPLRTLTTANRGELALVEPFIVNTRNGERQGQEPRTRSLHEPYFTPTAIGSQGGVVAPVLVGVGGRAGQSAPRRVDSPYHTSTAKADTAIAVPFIAGIAHGTHAQRPGARVHGMDEPLRTIDAGGGNHALCAAFLAQHNTGMVGHDLRKPISALTGKGCQQAPVVVKMKGTAKDGQKVTEPLHTVQAGGTHYALAEAEVADFVDQLTAEEIESGARVYAFLVMYYTSGSGKTGASLKQPIPTIRTKDGVALVVVKVGGLLRPIIDIGMRMLQPDELFAAQGFPPDYQIAPARNGKPLTKSAQIRLCGNSVCPPVAEALVRANFAHESQYEASTQRRAA